MTMNTTTNTRSDADPEQPTWADTVLRATPQKLIVRTGNQTTDDRSARTLSRYLRARNCYPTLQQVESERARRAMQS